MEPNQKQWHVLVSRLTYDIGCFPLDNELYVGKQERFETKNHAVCLENKILLPYLHDSRHTLAPNNHAKIIIDDADNILYVPLSSESRKNDRGVLDIYKKRFLNRRFRPTREEFGLEKEPVISLIPTQEEYGFFFPGKKHIVPTVKLGNIFTLRLVDKMIDVFRL